MKLKSAKAFVQEVAIILIGCFLTAFAVDCILKPSGLAVTGVTGVAMVLEHWFGINYTYTNYLFTLMIAVATYFLLGKKEFFRILALSIIYPVILVIFNHFSFQLIYDDLPLTCITFSLFYGTGIGMILRLGYSFGGSDTLAKILSVKSKGRITILLPLAIPISMQFEINVYIGIAAVVSGALFGDHCSPISDTTLLSATASGCDNLDHVRTQLPYALIAAGASAVGFLIAPMFNSPLPTLVISTAVMIVSFLILSKIKGEHIPQAAAELAPVSAESKQI